MQSYLFGNLFDVTRCCDRPAKLGNQDCNITGCRNHEGEANKGRHEQKDQGMLQPLADEVDQGTLLLLGQQNVFVGHVVFGDRARKAVDPLGMRPDAWHVD
ncbi:hypothetical protein D9M70_545850 [compost metagenome]